MSHQIGISLGGTGASAGSREWAAHPLPVRVRRAVSRCLHQLRHRLRCVPDMEIRHFSLRYDAPGPWILTGARCEACAHFRDLAAALSFARDDAGAGEAEIELWVEGLYIFVHQARGWPQRLCAPATTAR